MVEIWICGLISVPYFQSKPESIHIKEDFISKKMYVFLKDGKPLIYNRLYVSNYFNSKRLPIYKFHVLYFQSFIYFPWKYSANHRCNKKQMS